MKFATAAFGLLALPLAFASPLAPIEPESAHVAKRATPTDSATTGYASGFVSPLLDRRMLTDVVSSSTTGGKGGATTTVTTIDALTSAVTGDTAAIVYISGTLTGNTVVKIGSNKTVLGKAGSCASDPDAALFPDTD